METVSAESVSLTRVVQRHVHDQLVAGAAVQAVSAHSHHLNHIGGVGCQILDDRPLGVQRGRLSERTA